MHTRLAALLWIAFPALSAGAGGEDSNLLPVAHWHAEHLRGAPEALLGASLGEEGAAADTAGATFGADSRLELEFHRLEMVRALEVQAEGNAVLLVEASRDGHGWELLWRLPSQSLPGLRTRLALFTEGRELRFLRLRCAETAVPCVVSRIHAYRRPPAIPIATSPAGPQGREPLAPLLTLQRMGVVKASVAAVAALVLAWSLTLRRFGEGRAFKGLLLGLALFSALCFFNLFRFHFDRFLHVWEIYHYYVGAKYFPELGYTRLYACTALADQESGAGPPLSARRIRDLRSNLLTQASATDAGECRRYFGATRWQEFGADVAWFRAQFPPPRWEAAVQDHGYNGSPLFTLVGGALASTGPASDRQILLLALVDPLLLAVLWGLVLWAFGWRTLCVALIFWGTNYPAHYYWNGGAFLRQDWLLLSVAALCLMRRGRMFAAGAAVTAAALLRVFPALLLVGVVLLALGRCARERRLFVSPAHRRLLLGCVGAAAILVPLSTWRAGADAWPAFFENSRKHLSTPLTNNVGLATLLGYSSAGRARLLADDRRPDPYEPWKLARRQTQAARRPLLGLLLAAYLMLLARALRQAEDWQAAVLGIGLIPVVGEVTCYYYSILLGFAFLRERVPWSGPALLFYALSTWVCAAATGWFDEQFTCMSAFTLLLVGLVTWWSGSGARPVTDEACAPGTGLPQQQLGEA